VGRRSVYTEEAADEICRRIADGETLPEICRDEHMPPRQTVLQWDADNREGFASRYARARDRQIEHWADELLSISDDANNDWMERNDKGGDGWQINGEHIQRSRLRSDNRKWLLSKLKPGKYGDRLAVGGDADNPIKVYHRVAYVIVDPKEPREG
jgi:hypothetical protein